MTAFANMWWRVGTVAAWATSAVATQQALAVLGEEYREAYERGWKDGYSHVPDLGRANRMDAPGGPLCMCGKPSTRESGWCGTCDFMDAGQRTPLTCAARGCEGCSVCEPPARADDCYCDDYGPCLAHAEEATRERVERLERVAEAARQVLDGLGNRDGQEFMHRDASLQAYWRTLRGVLAALDEGKPPANEAK